MAHFPNRDALAAELAAELAQIPTVDAHEHLPPESTRVDQPRDFYHLFEHYCRGDLVAAGATDDDLRAFADRRLPVTERWQRFRPFLSAIRTGGYARAALLVVRDILEFDDLDDDTCEAVGERLTALNRPGLYDAILRDRCNLVACVLCWQLDDGPYPDYFRQLAPGPQVLDLGCQTALDALAARCDHPVHTLDDVLECMSIMVGRWRDNPTVVGIKSAHAYGRSLAFRKTSRYDAETAFNRVRRHDGHAVDGCEGQPLQDYLMYQLVARAEANGLPMVFHTGLQAGNFNRIANAHPLLLQELIEEFPRAKIDLFHAGMPWVREIAVLAKYFPNVYLNMAWTHIINPAQARSALAEWLDMVPNTKIFGFGGDYVIVEKVYGHLTIARQNIAAVLADKIREGAFSRADASRVARRLMHDNAARFYGL